MTIDELVDTLEPQGLKAAAAVTGQCIMDAQIVPHPTPHVLIDSVFPASLYQDISRYWPHDNYFTSIADTGRVTQGAYASRHTLGLNSKALGVLEDPAQCAFWRELAEWLTGAEFVSAMVKKSVPFLLERFGETCASFRYGARAQLVNDQGGFSLGPHTDITSRVFNLLFYCPTNDKNRPYGTSLYWPKQHDYRCAGGPHYPFEDFDRVDTIDFIPNRLFGFFKTDSSWHGVEPIPTLEQPRRTLSVKVFTADS